MWRVNVTFLSGGEVTKKKNLRNAHRRVCLCVWRLELLLGPVNANEKCESERAAAMRYSEEHVRLFSAPQKNCVHFFSDVIFFKNKYS